MKSRASIRSALPLIAKSALVACTALVAGTLLVAETAFAQETTATISGRVVAEDGQPLAGASVIVTHVPTGSIRTVATNSEGRFSAPGLRVGGPFKVVANKEGYDSTTIEDIFAEFGASTNLELAMNATTLEEITVASTREQERQVGVITNFTAQDIANLPSVSRDLKDIVRLDPKAIVDPFNADALSIAGTNNRFNSFTVDGIRQGDDFGLNGNGYPTQRSPISLEVVEALSVRTAPFDVEDSGFQGGTITVVTKSGTNDFKGSAYFYSFRDSLAGDKNKGQQFDLDIDEKTYGATLGGPIIEDKLFLFLGYEKLEAKNVADTGPTGAGFPVSIPNVSLADYNQILGIADSVYGFDAGQLRSDLPEEDRKILAKLDWQINDDHRLSLAYQNSEGNEIIPSNNVPALSRASASSNWYNREFPLEQISLQVFSQWNDQLSTEFKYGQKRSEGIQASLQGTDFAEMQVATSQGGTVYLGPDEFRHANALSNDLDQLKLKAQYVAGVHTIKAGIEAERLDVFNLFVPRSQGQYVFSSIANFQNRTATTLNYQNAVTNNAVDGGAQFSLDKISVYLQDQWQLAPNLTLTGGLRYEKFSSGDRPNFNQNFTNRYGFSNAETFDGRDLILPRFGFNWQIDDLTTLSGGVGLFGGGSPNVWLSNSFSNNGVTVSAVSVNAMSPAALQAAALQNVDGFDIPAAVQQLLAAGDGPVNAIDPDFEIPSSWKYNLSLVRKFDLGRLGDDWRLQTDLIYTDVKDAVLWRDIRRVVTGTAPDGRPIYSVQPGDTRGTSTQDLLLTNASEGGGFVGTLDISKTWRTDAGRFDFSIGYGYQNVDDVNSGTSSTASSNWDNLATANINDPGLARTNYEVKHRFPLTLNWRKAFFADAETSVGLFVERRSGQPYSYTFGNGSALFGDPRQAARQRQLFYVPRDQNDVVLAGGLTWAALDAYIVDNGLDKYRGEIAPRNAFFSRWTTFADMRIAQEIPAFWRDAKGVVSIDIENVANLLNSDWGRVEQVGFPHVAPVVNATGVVGGLYQYSPISGQTGPRPVATTLLAEQSVWRIQLGVKFVF